MAIANKAIVTGRCISTSSFSHLCMYTQISHSCKLVHISQHHNVLFPLVPNFPDPLAPSWLLCLCLQSPGAAAVLWPGSEPPAPPAGLRGSLSHPTAPAWQLHHVSMQDPGNRETVPSFKKLKSTHGLCMFFIYIVLVACCSLSRTTLLNSSCLWNWPKCSFCFVLELRTPCESGHNLVQWKKKKKFHSMTAFLSLSLPFVLTLHSLSFAPHLCITQFSSALSSMI